MGTLDKGAVQHLDANSKRRDKGAVEEVTDTAPSGRIMSSLASAGGLAGKGGIAGKGGGLAG